MINCPNPSCKTANPEGAPVCQVCQSALPHYYLWGVGGLVPTLKVNSLVNQRYLLKRDQTFLDTKPGIVPESPSELPAFLSAYLHLSAYPLHVPRVYSAMKTPDEDYLVMLESSALATVNNPSKAGNPKANGSKAEDCAPDCVPSPLPELQSRWHDAPPLRQLSWMWQIAQLWDAFNQEQVAATLLNHHLLRVDGSILRLLALEPDKVSSSGIEPPTLMDLGRQWQPLAERANQAVRAFLERLCEQLERQQLSSDQLCDRLSEAIAVCAQGQAVTYNLAVYTDQGPTRKRNEDACYPESGATASVNAEQTQTAPQLLIVCDGIGGHQGGDVASKLAIETIRTQLAPILTSDQANLTSTEVMIAIEEAICAANDEISAQNDRAQRQARDRMGTTLVLALMKGADVYIAHLGDSRAYRIGRQNCQQVTLDDDVASRQVRLAGGLYREALTQPGSGSLIQALGMGPSQTLRPTVQRFVIDDDCVFLLCSDGLSDSDRVEQFWQPVLRPLVVAPGSVADVGHQLINIANKYNGHDNVTVGLIHAQVLQSSERIVPREIVASTQTSAQASTQTNLQNAKPAKTSRPSRSRKRPQTGLVPIEPKNKRTGGAQSTIKSEIGDLRSNNNRPDSKIDQSGSSSTPVKAGLILLALTALGGLLYFLFPTLSDRFGTSVVSSPGGLESINGDSAPSTSPSSVATNPLALSTGSFIRIRGVSAQAPPPVVAEDNSAAPGIADNEPIAAESVEQILIYPSPESRAIPNTVPGTMPVGSVAEIVALQEKDDAQWVQIKLCTIPSGDSLAEVPVEGASPRQNEESSTLPLSQAGALLLSPGNEGWALSTELEQFAEGVPDLPPDRSGSCRN